VPRSLSYAQADHAISAVAARLRSFGLPTDAVVAMQLPNTVDSFVVFLGILRADMIAAPVPLLWRPPGCRSRACRSHYIRGRCARRHSDGTQSY
jgi:acyl-CoA synthetase (AMP-forming)/AMP-acid ligase II